jgi:hypothetical protein
VAQTLVWNPDPAENGPDPDPVLLLDLLNFVAFDRLLKKRLKSKSKSKSNSTKGQK